jgi:hypothetical protein
MADNTLGVEQFVLSFSQPVRKSRCLLSGISAMVAPMDTGVVSSVLIGRDQQLATLDLLIERARSGNGATLMVSGEAGIGKSALLDYVVEHELGIPVVPFPDRKMQALYRAFAVPQTLMLDQDGNVLFSRRGALEDRSVMDSIIRLIGTTYE